MYERINFFAKNCEEAVKAILAVLAPFGSLNGGPEGTRQGLAEALAEWASGRPGRREYGFEERKLLGHKIWEMIFTAAWMGGLPAVLTLGWGEVKIVTPTSKAEISIRHEKLGEMCVSVFFGVEGSSNRADHIIAEAERLGVKCEVYDMDGFVVDTDDEPVRTGGW